LFVSAASCQRRCDWLFSGETPVSLKGQAIYPGDRVPNLTPGEDHWPNDEVFVATTLANAGFSCRDFNDSGEYYTETTFSPSACFLSGTLVPGDGLLYHSVRSGTHYLQTVAAREAGAADLDFVISQIDVAWSQDTPELENCLRQMIGRQILHLGDDPDRILIRHPRLSGILRPPVKQIVARALVRALAGQKDGVVLGFSQEPIRKRKMA
jgi:hypothetical protein